ncbi:UDP-N-acetylmuramate--L-alanine ligase [Vallitaleaceae bacterium 9-2]
MKKNNLASYRHVFFIGIGGISMSGLAEVLFNRGLTISGSDQSASDITNHLKSLGANIYIGHDSDHIHKDIDLVVYTAAVKADNPELIKAKALNIDIMERATLLGYIMADYAQSIAVAGTHGKTTTTSMLAHILMAGHLDPTISVGAILKGIHGNFKIGHSDYFVTEACEYNNSFHKFFPTIGLVLNIEEDHLDFFKDIHAIRDSFYQFMQNIDSDGYLIINDAIDDIQQLTANLTCEVISVGSLSSSTYSYDNVSYNKLGHPTFDLYEQGKFVDSIHLHVTGSHNIENALAAIATGRCLNIGLEQIKQGLLDFSGANRRFEYIGTYNGITIIDDYAHHPTEIRKTIEAARHIDINRLYIVFQPHTYSRTKSLYNDFVEALKLADGVIITDIYAAREKDPGDIHASMIVESLSNFDVDIVYIDDFDEICTFIQKNCVPNDMLITMGAGNVNIIGHMLLNK